MLDHVDIRVSNRDASRRFYTTVFGDEPSYSDEELDDWRNFSIVETDAEHPVTRHVHIGFAAPSPEEVDAFWRGGVEAGYTSDGEPGPRPQYSADYYGGFLLDPDGNSVEAVHRPGRTESGPPIDHLWLGVADLDASRRFYETVAPVLRLGVEAARLPGMVVVGGRHRHVMLVADGRAPTENLHLAFTVSADEAVAEFHRVATEAGYPNNGGPGERPDYHPGYVAAFVLDPDGNNIEAVNHNR
jgi:catechol 2,3-dioxygenase-like lactoylglutathione lyase family enzyme